ASRGGLPSRGRRLGTTRRGRLPGLPAGTGVGLRGVRDRCRLPRRRGGTGGGTSRLSRGPDDPAAPAGRGAPAGSGPARRSPAGDPSSAGGEPAARAGGGRGRRRVLRRRPRGTAHVRFLLGSRAPGSTPAGTVSFRTARRSPDGERDGDWSGGDPAACCARRRRRHG